MNKKHCILIKKEQKSLNNYKKIEILAYFKVIYVLDRFLTF